MKKERLRERQKLLVKLISKSSDLDVVFLMDCTGSMSYYINETKEKIEYVVNFVKEEYENTVRIAFVGYRDHSDGDKRIECIPFTGDISQFKECLQDIKACGGDDTTEDVLGGLEKVGELNWSSNIKVLIHIADAPQHGQRFHNLGKMADNYFDIEPRGLKAEEIVCKIKEKKIKYFFVKINGSTDKMIKEFNAIAGKKLIQNIDLKSPDLLSQMILRSITQTLDCSIGDEYTKSGASNPSTYSTYTGTTYTGNKI